MQALTKIEHGSPEWFEARRSKINASTASAILYPGAPGVRGTPLSEYERIVNGKDDDPSPDLQKLFNWGTKSEPLHIEMLEEELGSGMIIVANKLMVVDPHAEWLVGTPDAFGSDYSGGKSSAQKAVIELKAPVYHDPWGDECPIGPRTQCQLYMMMTDADVGYVSALIPPSVRVFKVERDRDWEAWAMATLTEFWHENVVKRVPPKAMPTDASLLAEMPRQPKKEVHLGDDLMRKAAMMESMKAQVSDLEETIADCRSEILQSMGDAEHAVFSDGTGYSYLQQTRKIPAKEASVSTFRVLKRIKKAKD